MDEGPPKPDSRGRFLGDVLSFGWVLPAAIAAGAGLGWLLDRLLHTSPVLTIVFAFLGAAAGFRQVWKEMESLAKDDDPGAPKE
jgi:ATP synthase protein I